MRLPDQAEGFVASVNIVSAGYFELLDIPLVRGRTFTDAELGDGSAAVIVTEATARRLWPGQDPIGKTIVTTPRDIRTGESLPDRTVEVVGVAGDAQIRQIGVVPSAYLYLPAVPATQRGLRMVARSRADFAATLGAIRASAAALDPAITVSVEPLEANVDIWRSLARLVSTLSSSLGALALVLASIGVYGVVALAVERRVRELGIRIALGASARGVVALVLKRTMRPVVVGAVIGIAAAAAVSRVLSSVLFGVSPVDPIALIGAAVVVAAVALVAGVMPARRALRIDPMFTLRYE
jgi:putative ABC transport system permease protein